ncbi:MAG: NAD(P)-dependent oxidoreductase [Nocardioides sp.]
MSVMTVAVLGTGTMGAPMARNIAEAGLDTRVWDRTEARARPLADVGATVCASVGDAVSGADVVVTMLWDADSVTEALLAGSGHYAAGAVLVQASTVGVDGANAVGVVAEELGLTYVDAPVLGTKQPAQTGNLLVLASGPREAESTVAPVFEAIGAKTMWLGEAGVASRLKLVANAFVLSLSASIAQSVGLARALDVDPKLFLEAVSGGPLDNVYVQGKGGAMIAGTFPAAFGLGGGAKDAGLILAATADDAMDRRLMEAVHAQLSQVLNDGYGDEDIAAIVRVHERH